MKYFCCLFLIWLMACARPGTSSFHYTEKYKRLSAEIENTDYTVTASHANTFQEETIREVCFEPVKEEPVVNSSGRNFHKQNTVSVITKKVIARIKSPRTFNKYATSSSEDNIFSKIGYGLLAVGIVVILVLGYVSLQSSWGLGLLIAGGVGLGLIVLSLPFLLVGWLVGDKNDPPPSGPEDPVQ